MLEPSRLGTGQNGFPEEGKQASDDFSQSPKGYGCLLPDSPSMCRMTNWQLFPLSHQSNIQELFGISSFRKQGSESRYSDYCTRRACLPICRALEHSICELRLWVAFSLPSQPFSHPRPAASILTGTFSPWRMDRRGFSSCCYCALELWASGASSASAESHWISSQCCLLIWSRTSVKGKATGLKRGHIQHSGKDALEEGILWGEKDTGRNGKGGPSPFPLLSQGRGLWIPSQLSVSTEVASIEKWVKSPYFPYDFVTSSEEKQKTYCVAVSIPSALHKLVSMLTAI